MNYIKIFIIIILNFYCFNAVSFSIPNDGKVSFDIIRKNKVIGSHEIKFEEFDDTLIVETTINIEVKILFVTAYKFFHESKETWINGTFVEIEAYSDFEDEREYFVNGIDKNGIFLANGMDGELELDIDLLPSNFWNIEILNQKELFDTQKGILRSIKVKKLGSENIIINGIDIECNKYSFNASNNPKDKGPFPEYTLWYNKQNELIKFKFTNWKDKRVVTIIRNDLKLN